jgi:hypothetical protein
LIDELFLEALGRHPDEAELALALASFKAPGSQPRRVAEDLLWSLLNHPEFLFQH